MIDITPADDGINAKGRGSNSVIRITDGDITIINETGRDADGLDSNGDIYISGGNLFISVIGNGGNCAIDYGSENGGICKISGGTVIAAGGSAMAEGFDPSSEQCFIMYNTSNVSAGTTVSLKNSAGTVLMSEMIPCSFSSVVISTPELQMGETCTISIGDTEEEITVDNSSNSSGFGVRDMLDGGMQQGGFPGGMRGGRGGRMERFGGGNRPDADDMNRDNEDAPQNDFASGYMQGNRPDMGSGNWPDEAQFMQRGQNRDWMQGGEIAQTSVVSPETLILTGVSILFLLAGILIALKVKH